MFTQLRNAGGAPLDAASDIVLTTMRPVQVLTLLEQLWEAPRTPLRRSAMRIPNQYAHRNLGREGLAAEGAGDPATQCTWPHLIYAAMLEETRLLEIIRRVAFDWLHGERLPRPTQPSLQWLYVTEQAFFANPFPFTINSITSTLRPDRDAVRFNAYVRMFGFTPQSRPAEAGRPGYYRPDAVNGEFATVFEALLREVWRAYANVRNAVGPNETDDSAIADLARKLSEMLTSRRLSGALSREEFDAVAMLDWMLCTVDTTNEVMRNLNAVSDSTADRIRYLGSLVGVPAHARTDAYLQLARPMSNILLAMEAGVVNANTAWNLYHELNAVPGMLQGALTNDMLTVITNWSIVTGRNIKDASARAPVTEVIQAVERARAAALPSRDALSARTAVTRETAMA